MENIDAKKLRFSKLTIEDQLELYASLKGEIIDTSQYEIQVHLAKKDLKLFNHFFFRRSKYRRLFAKY